MILYFGLWAAFLAGWAVYELIMYLITGPYEEDEE